jgi:hypothetical protein
MVLTPGGASGFDALPGVAAWRGARLIEERMASMTAGPLVAQFRRRVVSAQFVVA